MITTLTALLIVFAAVLGSAAMIGVLGSLFYRIRQIEAKRTDEIGAGRANVEIEAMRDQLLSIREEMSALTERLDFTEKLLMSGTRSSDPDGEE